MSSKKISQLTPKGSNSASGDLFETTTGSNTRSVTLTQITGLEVIARVAGDAAIAATVTTEVTNRTNADTALAALIAAKVSVDGSTPMTANWDTGGFRIENIAAPVVGGDATNRTYVLGLKVTDLTAPTTSFSMNSHKIINLLDPTLAQDAATKNYVDTHNWALTGNSPGNDTSFIGTSDNHDFLLKTNAITRMYFLKGGNIGIGISPSNLLDIAGNDLTTSNISVLALRNIGSGVDSTETGIAFSSSINGNPDYEGCRIYQKHDGSNAGDARITIQGRNNGGSLVDVLSITGSGSGETIIGVGIGITAPTEKLHLVGNHKTTGQVYSDKFTLSDGATIALNWNNSNVQYVVLGGNRTFTFINPKDGAEYTLIIKQDGAGNRTLTWPATIVWAGGSAPTLSTAANKVDTIKFVYDGTNTKYYDTAISLTH